MRKEFEMTQEQLDKLLAACRSTPVMYLSGGQSMFGTPQDNANRAWEALGEELGFDGMSVQPSNKGQRFFTAIAKTEAA